MSESDWQPPSEGEGFTLGPEDALAREIEKSKALKIERLQLRNQVEALGAQVAQLTRDKLALETQIAALRKGASTLGDPSATGGFRGWLCALVACNLIALAALLVFLFRD